MNRIYPSSNDPELEQLAERFSRWRQCRATPRERIPVSLWDEAIALCHTRPLSRVARRLGLCTSDLKKRCQMPQPDTAPPTALEAPLNFVEVTTASWPMSPSVQLDVQRPDGTRLHLACPQAGAPLIELFRTFLAVK